MGEIQVGKMILSCTERKRPSQKWGQRAAETLILTSQVGHYLAVNPWCSPMKSQEAVPILDLKSWHGSRSEVCSCLF